MKIFLNVTFRSIDCHTPYRKKNSQYKNVFENGGENVIRNQG